MEASQEPEKGQSDARGARDGVSCPRCAWGRWKRATSGKGGPRCRCCRCDHTFAPPGVPLHSPGFGRTDPVRVAILRRLLANGVEHWRTLSQVADVSRFVAEKHRRQWRAEQRASMALDLAAYGVVPPVTATTDHDDKISIDPRPAG